MLYLAAIPPLLNPGACRNMSVIIQLLVEYRPWQWCSLVSVDLGRWSVIGAWRESVCSLVGCNYTHFHCNKSPAPSHSVLGRLVIFVELLRSVIYDDVSGVDNKRIILFFHLLDLEVVDRSQEIIIRTCRHYR